MGRGEKLRAESLELRVERSAGGFGKRTSKKDFFDLSF
jgi:hypothetical protein